MMLNYFYSDFFYSVENLMFLLILEAMLIFILYVVLPMLNRNHLAERIRNVAVEREKNRAQQKNVERIDKKSLRVESAAILKSIVDSLNLKKALVDEKTEIFLMQAGYRGQNPLLIFLILRIVLPIVFTIIAAIIFFIFGGDSSVLAKVGFSFCLGGGVGFYLPILFIRQKKAARQQSITQAWPDVLDLCLICVESGMPIEVAFKRVAKEIGSQSIELAQELSLTVAELSYLPKRQQAFNNLATRTGLDAVKNVVLSLLQAEKYGTPIGSALRTLSKENRDKRMSLAEKKAAALPPKLTVPMMLCFLPVLFFVILGPIAIRVFDILAS